MKDQSEVLALRAPTPRTLGLGAKIRHTIHVNERIGLEHRLGLDLELETRTIAQNQGFHDEVIAEM